MRDSSNGPDEYSFKCAEQMSAAASLQARYDSLTADLERLSHNQLVQLVVDEISENAEAKRTIAKLQVALITAEEETEGLRKMLDEKRAQVRRLNERQARLLGTVDRLQRALGPSQEAHIVEGKYEHKFRELSQYTDQYVETTNEAQEQFSRSFNLLKSENARLKLDCDQMKRKAIFQQKKATIFSREVRVLEEKIKRKAEQVVDHERQVSDMRHKLESISKERNEQSQRRQELANELDYLREHMSEAENVSRQIVDRFSESSVQFQKANREVQDIMLANRQLQEKVATLQQENSELSRQVEALRQHAQQFEDSQAQLHKMVEESEAKLMQENQQLIDQNERQRQQNDRIRRELVELAEQVRAMEQSYSEQMKQSQQVKSELRHFWEHRSSISSSQAREDEPLKISNSTQSQSRGLHVRSDCKENQEPMF